MKAEQYRKHIANILDCKATDIFFYWKGRIALYALLRAMGIKKDDEVILPGFTCVVVPNAVIYSGAKPVYVDISPDNYNMDINLLEKAITNRTRVIICQNTFGLSSNIENIIETAKKYNLYTIEDCTHGFGGYYNGKPNGSYCDAAFFSTQWNKPFSTGIGGILVVNNSNLMEMVINLEKNKIRPSFFDQFVLKSLITFRKYFVNNFTQNKIVSLYRFLSKHNVIIGSNQGDELKNIEMPDKYFKDISSVQVRSGLKQLKKLSGINEIRKKNAKDYTRFLKDNNKVYVDEKHFDNHLFLKYPLLVDDKARFFDLAVKSHIPLGDWFVSPLHPIEKDLSLWQYDKSKFPVAVQISRHILNLPTEIKDNKRVLRFLSEHLSEIM